MAATAEVDTVTTVGGVKQLRRTWAVPSPRAAVLLVHGIAEHSGRYEHVARQLNAAGMTVVGYDQLGHGGTGGEPGHVDSFTQFHDDVQTHLGRLRELGVPVVLLGHSMGGLVATSYGLTARPQPDLYVLSAPALQLALPRFARGIVVWLGKRLARRHLTLPLKPAALATDPRVGEAYSADPLVSLRVTFGLVGAMAAETKWIEPLIDSWSHRAMIVHGTDDEIVPPAASEALGRVDGVDRVPYVGLRHENFNEPSGPEVVADIIAWVDRALVTT